MSVIIYVSYVYKYQYLSYMNWGTPNDIKNMLDYGNKDYDLSYLNYEVVIQFDGVDDSIVHKYKYLEGRLTVNSDGLYQSKFVGIVRYGQLIAKISKLLAVYNSYCDSEVLSLKNVIGYKSICIIKFKDQSPDLQVCDIVRRLITLNITHSVTTQEAYMEIQLLNGDCRVSFFKEPLAMPKAIFLFIESKDITDYKHKLHTMANIMGVSMNNQNMFTDELTTVIVL